MKHSSPATRSGKAASLAAIGLELCSLEAELSHAADAAAAAWTHSGTRPEFLPAARNLGAFLALRGRDRTALQQRLARHGLSTLGRSDGHVLATVHAVQATVGGRDPDPPTLAKFEDAATRLEAETLTLLGPPPRGRSTRIVVTLDPVSAADPSRLRALSEAGMDAIRINGARDTPQDWHRMADAVRLAAAEVDREIRVLFDLPGPRVRTAAMAPSRSVRVHPGHRLVVRPPGRAGHSPDAHASFNCTEPDAVLQPSIGSPAAIDDGKILAVVESRDLDGLWLRVTKTRPGGSKLREGKGINFPGTELRLGPLTPADLQALDHAATFADMVGYSFVQDASDVKRLLQELAARTRSGAPLGIIAKIETARAFEALPEILAAAAAHVPTGVMIARGDLGVELGFPRLSEVQEEILWICQAAGVPVIWATEVLAQLVKKGVPARGEFTDAAMSARAEGVMLNRGGHLLEGVTVLTDVLTRAQRHFDKKTPQLRALRSWRSALR